MLDAVTEPLKADLFQQGKTGKVSSCPVADPVEKTSTHFSIVNIVVNDLPAQPSAVAFVQGLREVPVVQRLCMG